MNMYWNITTSLRHLKYPRNGLRMRLVAMAYLWPIVFQKTRLNRVDFLLTIPPFCVCVCMHVFVCVCLGIVLLLVRWVSVKRITTVSLLYPHTLSQRPTFTRPTFHTIQPPPSVLKKPCFEKPWISISNMAKNTYLVTLTWWSVYVCFLFVPLAFGWAGWPFFI